MVDEVKKDELTEAEHMVFYSTIPYFLGSVVLTIVIFYLMIAIIACRKKKL